MNKLIKLNLHGDLGENVGKEWEFATKSVVETISALNTVTKNKFVNYFINNNKIQAKYRILINGQDFCSPVNEINDKNIEFVNQSELVRKNNIHTIDIVPFLESNDSKILGIITLVVGLVLIATGLAAPAGISLALQAGLIIGGLTLAAAGIFALLSRPPEFNKFKREDSGKQSFLLGSPTNVIGEGGPVPVGYGRRIVGSQTIGVSKISRDYRIPRA